MESKLLGNIYGEQFGTGYAGNVYDSNCICPTLMNMQGGNRQPMIVENITCKLNKMPEGHLTSINNAEICDVGTETASTVTARYYKGIGAHKDNMCIVRQVGRNPENPTSRKAGLPTEQRLEPNAEGICGTLTSVQKDNMVLEKTICALDEQNMTLRHETFGTLTTDGSSPKHNNRVMETVKIKQATKDGYIDCEVGGVADFSYPSSTTRRGRVQDRGNTCPTLTAEGSELIYRIDSPYRIRKLTPLECWRLMTFTDEDFHKAEAVNSNTQLYKQAGNSIVVAVLEAIFRQMCIQNIPTWNEEKGALHD